MARLKDLRLMRIITIWVIDFLAIVFLAALLPKFHIESAKTAVSFVALLGILNALLWPVLTRITISITVVTLGLFSLILNAIFISITANLIPGIQIDSFLTTIFISIGLSAINSAISNLLAIDDSESYYRNVIKKHASKVNKVKNKKPGIIFLEIDGLSLPVFQRALSNAYMPNISRWLRSTHQVVGWETDLSAATPACQAGILLGDNKDMPAFRWYDRKKGKIVTMGNPHDSSDLEDEKGVKNGLLQNGMSVNNMFSGGASHFILTSSKMLNKGSVKKQNSLYYFFANPYNFTRTIALAVADVYHEIKDATYQNRQGVLPRVKRNGTFPLVRAITTVIMRDMGIYTIIGEMFAGVDVLYGTFVGYDEVAHHAGIERSEAMYTLQQLDKQFEKIRKATEATPRPYHLVILSDHGQSQGTTFKDINNMTLEEYIQKFVGENFDIQNAGVGEEGMQRVNSLLTEVVKEDKYHGKIARKLLKKKTNKGLVNIKAEEEIKTDNKLVVLVSGNLSVVYFAEHKKRLTLEKINKLYPRLIKGLVKNDSIGFVMVNSSNKGPVVIGKNGTLILKTGRVTGENPLTRFNEPNAVKHLIRSNSFKNAPDILINSSYDPGTDEIAPFEEFVGAHGGLGGNQNKPFIMYPIALDKDEKIGIVGAESLHKIMKAWAKTTR